MYPLMCHAQIRKKHVIAGFSAVFHGFFSSFPPISAWSAAGFSNVSSVGPSSPWLAWQCLWPPYRWPDRPYRCRGGPSHEAVGFGLTKAEVPYRCRCFSRIFQKFPEFSIDFPARLIRIRHLSHLSVIFDHLRFDPARYCCAMWPHHGLYCGLWLLQRRQIGLSWFIKLRPIGSPKKRHAWLDLARVPPHDMVEHGRTSLGLTCNLPCNLP